MMLASSLRPMKTRQITSDALRCKPGEVRPITVDHTVSEGMPEAGAWAESSFDLMVGAAVTEVRDTMPADLLDELFGPLPTAQ
jgi:hypothetical protein